MKLTTLLLLCGMAQWQASTVCTKDSPNYDAGAHVCRIPDSTGTVTLKAGGSLGRAEDWPDVPAVQEIAKHQCTHHQRYCWANPEAENVECPCDKWEDVSYWTCADKSRILLTAEDGTRWCHRVQAEPSQRTEQPACPVMGCTPHPAAAPKP